MLSEDEERFLKRTEILVKVMPVTILILLTISGLIIEENKTSNQLILELNKPNHHRSASGTMVLLYRREASSSRATN